MAGVMPVLGLGVVMALVIAVVGSVEVMEVTVIPVSIVGGVRSVVAKARVIATIHVAVKGITVMPGTCTDKYAAVKPFRPVVAVRSATIRRIAVVAIGTYGSRADSNADRNLGVRRRGDAKERHDGENE